MSACTATMFSINNGYSKPFMQLTSEEFTGSVQTNKTLSYRRETARRSVSPCTNIFHSPTARSIRNKAIVDIRLRPRCAISLPAKSRNSIYFLSLSPINVKLTLLSYVHASKSLVYLFLRRRSPLSCSPQKLPFPLPRSSLHVTHCSSGKTTHHPKRHLDRFSRVICFIRM